MKKSEKQAKFLEGTACRACGHVLSYLTLHQLESLPDARGRRLYCIGCDDFVEKLEENSVL